SDYVAELRGLTAWSNYEEIRRASCGKLRRALRRKTKRRRECDASSIGSQFSYGFVSMQPANFGLLRSLSGTGNCVNAPYTPFLKYAPPGNTAVTARPY